MWEAYRRVKARLSRRAAPRPAPRPVGVGVLLLLLLLHRYSWAELLRRVFAIDVLTCPSCGSRRRLIALITDPPVLRKILRHLGLPAEPPALAPPRSPPQMAFGY